MLGGRASALQTSHSLKRPRTHSAPPANGVAFSTTTAPKKSKNDKFAVFGLGNPGQKFRGTRHNIGFTCIDQLCEHYGIVLTREKAANLYGEGTIQGTQVLLSQPQTFMNLSGRAVRGLIDDYRIPPKNVVVIHDDVDLPLGTIRVKNNGSAGGQNGVNDIIRHLGVKSEFVRVKVGIGRPPMHLDTADYVLKGFNRSEQPLIAKTVSRVVQCVHTLVTEGLTKAMNEFNKSAEAFEQSEKKKEEQAKLRLQQQQQPQQQQSAQQKPQGKQQQPQQTHADKVIANVLDTLHPQ